MPSDIDRDQERRPKPVPEEIIELQRLNFELAEVCCDLARRLEEQCERTETGEEGTPPVSPD